MSHAQLLSANRKPHLQIKSTGFLHHQQLTHNVFAKYIQEKFRTTISQYI